MTVNQASTEEELLGAISRLAKDTSGSEGYRTAQASQLEAAAYALGILRGMELAPPQHITLQQTGKNGGFF